MRMVTFKPVYSWETPFFSEEGLDDPDAPKKVKFALNQKVTKTHPYIFFSS